MAVAFLSCMKEILYFIDKKHIIKFVIDAAHCIRYVADSKMIWRKFNMTAQKTQGFWQKYNLIVHAAIMLAIMLIIGNAAPVGTITPLGMRLCGIFIAALYGWTVCGLFWSSLMAIMALAFSGLYDSLAQFLTISFGNETLVFMLLLFGFTEVISEVGLVDYIANKMISFKFLNNRP